MSCHKRTVHIHLRNSSHTFETQEDAFVLQFNRKEIVLFVVGRSFVELVILRLHIFCIPCVRNLDLGPSTLPFRRINGQFLTCRRFLKYPTGIKRLNNPAFGLHHQTETGQQQG